MFSEQPSWFRMFRIALAMLAGVLQVSQGARAASGMAHTKQSTGTKGDDYGPG